MVLEVSHLQRAHILAAYIGKLKPAKQNMTHLQGNSLKNYLDAICRRIQQLENSPNAASEKFGNWSIHSHNQYHIVRQVLSQKVTEEHFAYPSKQKKSRVSDSITNRSFKMPIDCTLELQRSTSERITCTIMSKPRQHVLFSSLLCTVELGQGRKLLIPFAQILQTSTPQ